MRVFGCKLRLSPSTSGHPSDSQFQRYIRDKAGSGLSQSCGNGQHSAFCLLFFQALYTKHKLRLALPTWRYIAPERFQTQSEVFDFAMRLAALDNEPARVLGVFQRFSLTNAFAAPELYLYFSLGISLHEPLPFRDFSVSIRERTELFVSSVLQKVFVSWNYNNIRSRFDFRPVTY